MPRADIWLWSLDSPDEGVHAPRQILAAEEIARADRFVNPLHRDRYIAGRARMRRILGAELGCHPRDVALRYCKNGKPFIVNGPHFNLSHSGGLAALAMSADCELGIDIEKIRPIEDAVARRHFSAMEYATLCSMPADRWLEGFFRCWTRKEAVIKACGLGLNMALDSFDVTLTSDSAASVTRFDGQTPGDWRLVPFLPCDGWIGAVAAPTGGQSLDFKWREPRRA